MTIGTPPGPFEAPRFTVRDPGWTPGPAAVHELGSFQVDGSTSFLTAGWSPAGPDVGLEGREDCLVLSLAPGRWSARLVVQADDVPFELSNELSSHPEGRYLASVFAVLYCRPWLVLARDGAAVDIPRQTQAATARLLEEAQRTCDASGCDAVEALPLTMNVGADRIAPLSCIGRLEPWEHRIAFLLGASLSREASASLRASAEHLACSWDWGLVFRCGRAGLLPIFAADSGGPLVAIAVPGGV